MRKPGYGLLCGGECILEIDLSGKGGNDSLTRAARISEGNGVSLVIRGQRDKKQQ